MDTTRGSSAFRTATSPAASSVTISDFARTVCSMPPNSPGVREADLQHDADVGVRHPHEARDLADGRRTHLRDEELGVVGELERRDRSADLVVERLARRDGVALPLQDLAEQVLRRRLAVRARDADDPEPPVRADTTHDLGRERAERVDGVGHDDLRHRQVERVLDHEQGGALVRGGGGEAMSVVELAALGEEHAALDDLTGVGGDGARDDRVGGGIRSRRGAACRRPPRRSRRGSWRSCAPARLTQCLLRVVSR